MKFECTVCGKTQNCFQAYEGLIPEEEIKRNVKERGGVMMQWCPYCDKVRVHKASEDDYMELLHQVCDVAYDLHLQGISTQFTFISEDVISFDVWPPQADIEHYIIATQSDVDKLKKDWSI